jgi:hypothetical protein
MVITPSGSEPHLSVPARPRPVTVAGVILLVTGGLGILACGGVSYLASAADLSDQDRHLLTAITAILVGVAILSVVLGFFILRGRQWARVTAIVMSGLGVASSVASLFTGGMEGASLLGSCLGTLLNLLVIGLLSGPVASDYFRHASRWRARSRIR